MEDTLEDAEMSTLSLVTVGVDILENDTSQPAEGDTASLLSVSAVAAQNKKLQQ